MTWPTQFCGDEDPDVFLGLFAHRRNAYAEQQADGRYFKVDGEVNHALALRHLEGKITVSFYPLVDDTCIFGALDFDYSNGLQDGQRAAFHLRGLGFMPALESSRRGCHVWLLCVFPVEAYLMRRLLIGVIRTLGLTVKSHGQPEGVEILPSHDRTERYGQPMRAPIGIHRKSGKRYPLVDAITLKPYEPLTVGDQLCAWGLFLDAKPDEIRSAALMFPDHVEQRRRKSGQRARIDTRSLDILQWAVQLTHLDRNGNTYVGLCPFHLETKGSFTIYPKDPVKPHAHCYGCGWHGDAADLKAHATGQRLADVLREARVG